MLFARSKTPTTGLVTALHGAQRQHAFALMCFSLQMRAHPTRPMPTPLKKPAAPPVSAPSSGLVAKPSKPLATLVTREVAPAVTPYKACFGRFRN